MIFREAMRNAGQGNQWGKKLYYSKMIAKNVCMTEKYRAGKGGRVSAAGFNVGRGGGGGGFATTTTSSSSTSAGSRQTSDTAAAAAAAAAGAAAATASTASSKVHKQREAAKESALYFVAVAVATLGATYASVPLYRLFCQATGFGGTTARVDDIEEKLAEAQRRASSLVSSNASSLTTSSSSSSTKATTAATDAADTTKEMTALRPITVEFTSEVAASLPWKVRITSDSMQSCAYTHIWSDVRPYAIFLPLHVVGVARLRIALSMYSHILHRIALRTSFFPFHLLPSTRLQFTPSQRKVRICRSRPRHEHMHV